MNRHHEELSLLGPLVLGSAGAIGVFAKAWLASKQAKPTPEETAEPAPKTNA